MNKKDGWNNQTGLDGLDPIQTGQWNNLWSKCKKPDWSRQGVGNMKVETRLAQTRKTSQVWTDKSHAILQAALIRGKENGSRNDLFKYFYIIHHNGLFIGCCNQQTLSSSFALGLSMSWGKHIKNKKKGFI